jgi:helicase
MTEGDTIIFDNPVGDPLYTNPYNRQGTQLGLYVNPVRENLRSAMATVIPGSGEYYACLGELSSQFLAAVPENPDDEDLVATFAANLYSSLEPGVSNRVRGHLDATRASILDRSREALATAASPLILTPFGQAALCTGFSPDSCRLILECLRDDEPETTPDRLGHHLLLTLGTLPEQYHNKLSKILGGKKNHQFQVKVEDLPSLLKMWLEGDPIELMFLSLPALKRSSKTPKVSVWAGGLDEPTVWDDDYDKFCDVVKQVFQDYIPWLMFACKQLSGIANGWSESVPWDTYSSYYESGVDSPWAVAMLRSDAPVERRASAVMGRALPDSWLSESDPLGLKALRANESRRQQFSALVTRCIEAAGGPDAEAGAELQSLKEAVLAIAGETS